MSRVGAVRTLGYQVLLVAVAVIFVGATFMGVYDPELTNPGRWEPISIGFMVGAVVLATRACMLGVTVRGDAVVVRNLEWTHRLSRAEVVAVRVVNYDGRLGGSPWHSWWWTTVRLTLGSGREVTAYGLLGRRTVVTRHAARLRALVGLPEPAPRTSRRAAHRANRG